MLPGESEILEREGLWECKQDSEVEAEPPSTARITRFIARTSGGN